MAEKSKLTWWAPRWSYATALTRVYANAFSARSIVRIYAIATLIGIAIVLAAKAKFPQFVLPPVWQLLPVVFFMPLYLAAHFAMQFFIKPYVVLQDKAITIQHGQSPTVIKSENVLATQLFFHPQQRVRLALTYTSRGGKRRVKKIGVAEKVDLNELRDQLPVRPSIHDARGRRIDSLPTTTGYRGVKTTMIPYIDDFAATRDSR